jgi:hypothetical protein
MRKIELSPEQMQHLVLHFADTTKKELAQQLGISIPLLYKYAHALQLDLPGPANKIHLEAKQLDYLVRNFKDHENEFLAFHLGISETTLHRLARRFGLKKSPAFLKARSVEGGHTSIYYHRKRDDGFIPPKGTCPPGSEKGWFKKGEKPIDRLGPKKEAARIEKAAASRRATRLDEKIRLQRGLPQRTKLKFRTAPPGTYAERHYLKSRGYILDNDALVAYWNEETRRSPRLEANPKIYTFRAAV